MNQIDYWKKFEQTGSVNDYLIYTACTSEEATCYGRNEVREGGSNCDNNTYDRDGFINHANWRL
jgi:hypothetical protein